jgi:outer membrane protein assembly factor BamB
LRILVNSVLVQTLQVVWSPGQYISTTDGHLYALNASNGAKLWSFGVCLASTTLSGTTNCRPSGVYGSSPAVANGVVYITSNSSLYALNASTGALLWSYDTSSGRNYSSTAVSSPTVVDGTAGWQRPESIRERSSLHWDANCRLHLGNRDQGGSSSQAANSRLTKSKGKSKNFSKE